MDISKHLYKGMEGILVYILENIVPSHNIHWDPEEYPVKLVPDIIVGSSPFSPDIVFLVTHESAQNASQVKSWRDLHEYFLYERGFPKAKICRFVFGKKEASSWAKAMNRIMDFTVYTDELDIKINNLLTLLTKRMFYKMSRKEVLHYFHENFIFHDELIHFQTILTPVITKIVNSQKISRNSTTNFENSLIKEPFFPTSLRRAVVFSSILPESVSNTQPGKIIFNLLKKSGLIQLTLWGYKWIDPYSSWIEESKELIGAENYKKLVKKADVHSKLIRIRWKNMVHYHQSVINSYEEILNSSDPGGKLKEIIINSKIIGGIPLLLGIRYLQKISSPDGFGNPKILRMAGITPNTANLYKMSRLFNGEKDLLQDRFISPILNILQTSYHKACEISEEEFLERVFPVLFFDEAVKKRKIEPLLWMLQSALKGKTVLKSSFPTIVDPKGKIGTLRVILNNNNLYHWKTAHKGHRDKAKELSAKGWALRKLHKNINEFILILDGDFTGDDIDTLSLSGWTKIIPVSAFYENFPKIITN